MPKINVYLPDSLADTVRETGVPVSAICQRALEFAVRRIGEIQRTVGGDLTDDDLTRRFPQLTARAANVVGMARSAVTTGGVTTGDLLRAIVAEDANMAMMVLRAMEVDTAALVTAPVREPGPAGDGLRFSTSAANALVLAVAEATALGHNYVGCEHLLIGLAGEPDGAAGRLLSEAGADAKAVRRSVQAALAGWQAHKQSAASPDPAALVQAVVRQELEPLVRRVEALESQAA